MPPEIPDYEPTEIVAGDTVEWTKVLADYPASAWALKYRIVGQGIAKEIAASADGDAYAITIPAADTAAIQADVTARLFGYVESGVEKHTVYDDRLRIKPNPRTASVTDLQSHAERAIAALEARIEDRLTADIESYSINGRSVSKIPILECRKLLGQYRAQLWREQHEDESHPTHAIHFSNAE